MIESRINGKLQCAAVICPPRCLLLRVKQLLLLHLTNCLFPLVPTFFIFPFYCLLADRVGPPITLLSFTSTTYLDLLIGPRFDPFYKQIKNSSRIILIKFYFSTRCHQSLLHWKTQLRSNIRPNFHQLYDFLFRVVNKLEQRVSRIPGGGGLPEFRQMQPNFDYFASFIFHSDGQWNLIRNLIRFSSELFYEDEPLLFQHIHIWAPERWAEEKNSLSIVDELLWRAFCRLRAQRQSSSSPAPLLHRRNSREPTWLLAESSFLLLFPEVRFLPKKLPLSLH